MKQSEIKSILTGDIYHNAYCAACCQTLCSLDYDSKMMDYHENTYNGEAFEAIRLLNIITNSTKGDDLYEKARSEALADIKAVDYDIIKILDMAGFDGKAHYEVTMKYA